MRHLSVLVCLLICACVSSSEELDIDSQQLAITLAVGSDRIWTIPNKYPAQQKVQISPFLNKQSNTTSFPCSVEINAPSLFHRNGKIDHQRSTSNRDHFWKGGQIWDAIHADNRIVCVFESGEVSQFQARGFETTYKPFQRQSTTEPLTNKTIGYGRLLQYRQPEDTLHILYVGESGCYLIDKNNSWTKLSGFNGSRVSEAKIYRNQIYLAFESSITIYSIDINQMLLTRETEYTVYFRENSEEYPLTISSIELDLPNNRIYFIDSSEGIKYSQIQSSTKNQAKALLPSQNCQQIIFIADLLLMSCSHLVIANSTNLRLLKQVRYPFRIRHLIFNQGYLTAFGHQYYTIYSISFNSQQMLFVQERVTGKLPDGEYSHILYLSQMKFFLLFSKESMEYGVIAPAQYQLHCAYSKVVGSMELADLKGSNLGALKVIGQCDISLLQGIEKECSSLLNIKVDIYDLMDYKVKLQVLFFFIFVSLFAFAVYRILRLQRKRNRLRYAQFNEQIIRQQNTDAERSVSDAEATKVSQMVNIIQQ